MIKLSKRGEYGMEILVILAKLGRDGYVSLGQISKENSLPLPFLSSIMSDLKKAGLVSSKEGVSGGYALMKQPQDIDLLSVINALEGSSGLVACLAGNSCKRIKSCTVQRSWNRLNNEFIDFLKGKTLNEFIK